MSVSAVQWSESAICIHIPHFSWAPLSPPPPSHPSRSSQSAELSSLCYATASCQLATLHMVVWICQGCSPNLSHPLLHSLFAHILSLHLCVYSCPAKRLNRTLFYAHLSCCIPRGFVLVRQEEPIIESREGSRAWWALAPVGPPMFKSQLCHLPAYKLGDRGQVI